MLSEVNMTGDQWWIY